MNIKSIENFEIRDGRVILRVDFNVPVKKGKVEDSYKLKRALPTIKQLLKNKNQIVLVSHLGRPKGKRVKALSLEPVFKELKKMLVGKGYKMKFFPQKVDAKLVKRVNDTDVDILFLENMRYDKREDENRKNLALLLAKMGDVYVNESFAASHRKMSSLVEITNYLPSFAGLNLVQEVSYLNKSLKPKKPAVALIGGSKIRTKIALIKGFLKTYNKVLIGGGLANTFFAAKGYEVGGSLFEPEELRRAKLLLQSKKIILPKDVLVSDKKRKKIRVVKIGRDQILCEKNEMILDIGPETVKRYADEIKKAKFIIWNGPLGLIEEKKFSHGTIALAKFIGSRATGRAVGIAGGGETLLALKMSGMEKYYDFVSTGGGSMLQFMEGKVLPGIKPLIIK
jgi:phosphoglycerate kinase